MIWSSPIVQWTTRLAAILYLISSFFLDVPPLTILLVGLWLTVDAFLGLARSLR